MSQLSILSKPLKAVVIKLDKDEYDQISAKLKSGIDVDWILITNEEKRVAMIKPNKGADCECKPDQKDLDQLLDNLYN